MRRKLNTLAGALLGALLVLTIPLVIAAEGDTNFTNIVLSGDMTVGDDLTVTDDATISGDLTVSGTFLGGAGNIGSEATPVPAVYATDLDVDDDLVVDDDALISGDLTVTGTTALNGHTTLANTKDLLFGTDGGSDIGASGTEAGTIWVQILDDGDGTLTIAAAAEIQGNATISGNVLPDGDSTRDLGSAGASWNDLHVDGDVVLTGADTIQLGSVVPTMATTKGVWLYPSSFDSSTTGAAELKNGKATIALADAAADEHIYITWGIPPDFDDTQPVTVQILWMCDDATVTAGEWDVTYLAVAENDADAAVGGEVTVIDLGVQNQWMLADAMTIPEAAFGASDHTLHLDVYHDVSDPLCNAQDVNVAGVLITYTTDKNY